VCILTIRYGTQFACQCNLAHKLKRTKITLNGTEIKEIEHVLPHAKKKNNKRTSYGTDRCGDEITKAEITRTKMREKLKEKREQEKSDRVQRSVMSVRGCQMCVEGRMKSRSARQMLKQAAAKFVQLCWTQACRMICNRRRDQ